MTERPTVERELPSLLRREMRLLESALLRILEEAGGPELVAAVESVRRATVALREDPVEANRQAVVDIVSALDLERAEQVARAFTIYFQLVNLAEEHHRVHDLRERGREEDPLHDSVAEAVRTVREWEGDEALSRLLRRLEVTPVLTAHPTEARRRAVVEALNRIAAQIARLDDPRLTISEETEIQRRLLEEVAILWRTDQLRPQKPTPLDEVRAVMALFDESIFGVTPAVYRALDHALEPGNPGERPPAFRAFIRWGSWVGGDRDGNPSVTPETTIDAVGIQADHVLRGLESGCRSVSKAMGASAGDAPANDELLKVLDDEEHVFPEAAAALRERMADQPHRRMLLLVAERIAATRGDDPGRYGEPEELLDDLRLVQRSLDEAGAPRLAYGELQHLVWQAETFGFHLASLEVRQHAEVLRATLRELIPAAPDDAHELNRLAIEGWPKGTAPLSDRSLDVLETFRAMQEVQRRYGPEGCHRFVVSFTRTAADVVAVRALARLAVPDGALALDVVPLFESWNELERAPDILDELFELQGADAWLESRGRRLEVMLGYSDSAKEVGVLATNIRLYKTQAELAEWANGRNIELTLFHGRGGALGRGGGPTNRAIWAQAPGSVSGRFKVTEQGEVTFARYSNPQIAHRHLEQVTNAVLLASTRTSEAKADAVKRHEQAAARMAKESMRAYKELVGREGFVEFFLATTPIDEIGRLPIGSRPASRGESGDFESLRAIPWVFAWAQSRCNLPGWYGLGAGLRAVAKDYGGMDELRAMYTDWPFFTSLLENAELSLIKADMPIAQLYFGLGDRPELAAMIEEEYRRTVELVLAVTGHSHLLAEESRLRRDIELRNPYIDALSFLQVRFLREIRDGILDADSAAQTSRLVQLTVNGVAAGLQNTG
ncbi:MAG: phosphoenolpyruvate carboxylase [Actinomycetota bacterium]